jgi:phosphodiester glycosidase
MRAWPAAVVVASAVVASVAATAACSGPPAGPGPGPGAGSPRAGAPTASPRPAHPHLAAADGAGATPVSGPPGVGYARVRTADGSLITVVVFHGDLRFVLHNGSQDPGPAAAALVRAGPAVTGAERRQLLAAFNGGFKLRSRAGGYEQEGHVIRALRRGLASLVIDRSGRARIGVWGGGVPVPGQPVYSVLQNLWPLVMNGKPTAETARWWRWGGTVGHAAYVARSAVGQTASGDLMYAASMSTVPADLASVLAVQGARTAMELDINPFWVQLDAATAPDGPLTAQVPGQEHPAGQYLAGWTRDFIAVLAGEIMRS